LIARVVVEPSDYVLRNAGDMAMLEVAVTRLADSWPDASVLVLSDTPDALPRYRPNVVALDAAGRRAWLEGRRDDAAARSFIETVSSARLLAVGGMGGITDAFPEYAAGVLATLSLAIDHRVPTVMLSQGMGPLEEPSLRSRTAAVLSRVDLIALREELAGGPLLRSLGVDPERVITTGDDAIEMAYTRRPAALGPGLGINLRAASYSEVGADLVDEVGRGIQRSARRHGAPLIAIPISRVPGEEDAGTILRLAQGYPAVIEGPRSSQNARDAIDQVIRCRVVVTGSYHAGVFALACGIPVVAVAKSRYYVDKFLGLSDQFGDGCEVVVATTSAIADKVDAAIQRLWLDAEVLRPRLLVRAARQVATGRAAYLRVAELGDAAPR
jgi:polysaccharide pyruvyl transferase WcaK-like protein